MGSEMCIRDRPVHLTEGEHAGEQTTLPRLPVEFGNQKPPLHRDLPRTGADNAEVLKELGLDDEAIAVLASEGVLGG